MSYILILYEHYKISGVAGNVIPKGDFSKELLREGLVVQVFLKNFDANMTKPFYMHSKTVRKWVSTFSKEVKFWHYSKAVSSYIT